MQYSKLEYYISKPRLDRFLINCSNDTTRAQALYQANLKVAESFYSVLNMFEVFLRNKINHQLSIHFQDPEWLVSQKNGFMNDASLAPSMYFLKSQVLAAEKRIKKRNKSVTSGLVIAEQSLGFWTSLFDTHHYRLLSGDVIHCFRNKPSTIQRKQINLMLDDIRDFRNRIYHNEPICFNTATIDFSKAIQVRKNIYNLLEWIDPDTATYISGFDTIDTNIKAALQI